MTPFYLKNSPFQNKFFRINFELWEGRLTHPEDIQGVTDEK